jgi:hypothetical protein
MSDLTGTIDDKGKKKKPDGVAKQVVLKPPKKGVAGTDEHTNLRVWKRDVVNHENAREESSERNLGFHKRKRTKFITLLLAQAWLQRKEQHLAHHMVRCMP